MNMLTDAKVRWKWVTLVACLSLPACSTHAPAPVASLGKDYQSLERGSYRGSFYEVQKGDTLYFISYITGKDVKELVSSNNLSQPYTIFPGQKLRLWKPKYVAPKYGRAAPVVVASTTTKTPAKTASRPVQQPPPSQPKPAAKPKPASQQTAAPATATAKTEQKTANKTVDQARAKEYSQKTKSNKVVTTKPKVTNNKVSKWTWPAKGRVIAKFSNAENGNKGIDIAGQRGQDINASANGVVVYAGNALRGYGNLVIIKHSDDYLSAYAHNDQVLVKEQQKVTVGQKIASMGSSGTSDVRLHFEIRYKGKSVDPMRYLPR
ncbi:murein hydrolase activator NlpD [Photobacterium makurazakiensis]|uniref:murein hydrolase activator NlpD n=1 Tax=Photobacterium makurazakiensis TaxID=2910234 RepID=UPI003D0985FA